MISDRVPQHVAVARAAAVYGRALARIAADRAAGRLTPEQEALHDRLYARQTRAREQQLAA